MKNAVHGLYKMHSNRCSVWVWTESKEKNKTLKLFSRRVFNPFIDRYDKTSLHRDGYGAHCLSSHIIYGNRIECMEKREREIKNDEEKLSNINLQICLSLGTNWTEHELQWDWTCSISDYDYVA